MTFPIAYTRLYKRLGYQFRDPAALQQALTHRSASKNHNERLEYLGDSVLGMVIADALYHKFPSQPEGKLTRMRSSLVKGDTLAEIGREFELGDLLILGPGELKSGGHRRDSILSDAVEAIIGAIYLESGIEVVRELLLNWFASRIDKLDPNQQTKDDKTRLQEYLQSRQLPLPQYEVTDILGKDHAQTFVVQCRVSALATPVEAKGNSRRRAEQAAARIILEKLNND